MRANRRFLGTVGAVCAAVAVALVPTLGHASDGDVDVIWFAGSTTALNPGVQLVGGSGTYSFNTSSFEGLPGICGYISTDTTPPEVAAGSCSVTSSGSYTNIVCGTGSVIGSTTVTEADGGSDTYGIDITFAAGLGVVTSTSGGTAVGVVQLLPPLAPPPGPPVCVNQFDVVGAAVTTN